MNDKIKCKAEHDHSTGCFACGGYKYVLHKWRCPTCKRYAWLRPGAFTIYEGKRFTSIDGLDIVFHLDAPMNCVYCEEKS